MESLSRPQSLRQQAYESLRQSLRNGQLPPAERLTETGLAAMLGVSRTPVREALGQLSREGLIEAAPGGGFRAAAPDRRDLEEVFEVRVLIEPHAVARAADNPDAASHGAGVDALRAAIDAEVAHLADENPAAFATANHDFRVALFSLCGNRRLARTIEMYDDHVQAVRLATLHDRHVREAVIAGQRQITEAVSSRDAEGAAAAMQRHLTTARDFLLAALDVQQDTAAPRSDIPGRAGDA